MMSYGQSQDPVTGDLAGDPDRTAGGTAGAKARGASGAGFVGLRAGMESERYWLLTQPSPDPKRMRRQSPEVAFTSTRTPASSVPMIGAAEDGLVLTLRRAVVIGPSGLALDAEDC